MRRMTMKVEGIGNLHVPATKTDELPIIKEEEIKSILYLGLRGAIKLDPGKTHAIDTYA
jgi:hypothetical protein